MTAAGVLLGTAAYMSPEQARGHAVDKRTDIWAFGAVLYQMLTGRRAFPGDDVSDVLASVLAREPDWTALPDHVPAGATVVIKQCLQKDRKLRLRDIGDVSLALSGPSRVGDRGWCRPRPRRARRGVAPCRRPGGGDCRDLTASSWATRTAPEPRPATRFDYVLPAGQEFANTARPVIAAVPDGRGFMYQAQDGLYLRPMGELAARLIRGADGVNPFVSPDGEWVGFFGAGALRKVNVSGGVPVALCAATIPSGASWAADGTILSGQREAIMRVSADGGTPELLIRAADNEELYGPQLMPDGQFVLFSVTTARGPNRWGQGQVVVQSLATGARTVVVTGGMDARYLSTGHIV